MKKEEQKIIAKEIDNLFSLLSVSVETTVTYEEDAIDVVVASSESGMLIGYHGETLEALQLMLSLMISKKIGRFVRVSLEVDNYKKKRIEYLTDVVGQAKQKALEQQASITLPYLKSWERRIIHTLVAEDDQVISESQGEGRDRVLTIRPKA